MLERTSALGGSDPVRARRGCRTSRPTRAVSRGSWFWKRCFWGIFAAPRLWPDSRVSGYELLRTAWHAGRSACNVAWAGLRRGPRSAECFEKVLKTALLTGAWFGLVGELRRRGGFFGRPRAKQSLRETRSLSVVHTP